MIEHTARAMGGNSGGPLATDEGRVRGVHYASVGDLDLRYTISREEALKVIDDLKAGNDVTSIGVNGTAVAGEELSGIWVSAVESGSPAALVGIQGGDIITEMEGLVLATDGTMADYCDILRSHDPSDPLAVEVLRFSTEEVLAGTLNSDEEMELAFSFASELEDEVGVDPGAAYEYVEVCDDDGVLVMQIPTAWTEVDGSGWNIEGTIVGSGLIAAPSLDEFYTTWDTPGVFFGASEALYAEVSPGDLLDAYEFSDSCTYEGRSDYEDAHFTGSYGLWGNCEGTDTAFIVLEAYPSDGEYVVLVQVQIVSEADLEALDVILATFDVL